MVSTNLSGVRLLLVDADPRVATGLRKVLVRSGCEVFSTGSAQRARRYLGRSPEIVLLDLMVPLDDCIALCDWLRGTPQPPRIVVTGRDWFGAQQRAGQLAADAYVLKPYTLLDVVAGVRRVLEVGGGRAAGRDDCRDLVAPGPRTRVAA
jgi:DNA-binding response OmpR family regulator